MKIFENSIIDRTCLEVWPYIITSEHFQKWNDKIKSMEARGRFVLGQTFVTHYQMGRKEIQCASTVTQLEEASVLELRHTSVLSSQEGPLADLEVVERITLTPKNEKTLVVKEVNFKNHHTNIFICALIWLITRFGSPVGPNKLKNLCEGRG
jgi:hypothetical protein